MSHTGMSPNQWCSPLMVLISWTCPGVTQGVWSQSVVDGMEAVVGITPSSSNHILLMVTS